jgi:hypothetical protein
LKVGEKKNGFLKNWDQLTDALSTINQEYTFDNKKLPMLLHWYYVCKVMRILERYLDLLNGEIIEIWVTKGSQNHFALQNILAHWMAVILFYFVYYCPLGQLSIMISRWCHQALVNEYEGIVCRLGDYCS